MSETHRQKSFCYKISNNYCSLLIHSYHFIGFKMYKKSLDSILDKKITFEEYTGESCQFLRGKFSWINFFKKIFWT